MTEQSHYTVLARRFRPQQFDDVVGQQHIAQALQNAIRAGRVAHAYLFTGARGVGKTSTARILAKALNCPNVADAVPCNTCDICRSISAGNDVDVLEIDGASNRRIDDIRDIRANVNVKSMRSRYKVYIIDEVHMLTTEAFNALLKTLEEPPPNVKFVFCTTEPQKVPDTILSRCQRFDFSTIGTDNITSRLQQIAEAEGYQVDPEALELVARRAAGSMRDSQSLFDQLLAFGETHLTVQDVHGLLGTAHDEHLIAIYDAILHKQPEKAFEIFDEALVSGVQLSELFDQLLTYARDLMIAGTGAGKVSLQAVFEANRETLTAQAREWGLETIVTAMQILGDTKGRMAKSVNARSLAELALMRLTMLGDLQSLTRALHGLENGQFTLQAGPSNGRGGASPSQSPRNSATAPPQKKNEGNALNPSNPVEEACEPEVVQVALESGNEAAFLAQLVSSVDDKLKPHLQACEYCAISGPNQLDFLFPMRYDFSRQYCERPASVKSLQSAASRLAGQSVQVRVLPLQDTDQTDTETDLSAGAPPAPTVRTERAARLEDVEDEFVKKAADIFGAQLVKVLPLSQSPDETRG